MVRINNIIPWERNLTIWVPYIWGSKSSALHWIFEGGQGLHRIVKANRPLTVPLHIDFRDPIPLTNNASCLPSSPCRCCCSYSDCNSTADCCLGYEYKLELVDLRVGMSSFMICRTH
ncbi:hypothetical protein CY34DRAFT_372619 [Suillus luteus UH-Slu-Lm8-n1]|uniref:Uncharacterized protein n=1 Tax=Suillus luteus UH-Slu-Lm8-n1 TaxID=930992 RepID=A0A0C9ZMB1_9AGAM|nr:hypothetical protein CY34DRAFT_372619 [Suillus luteus UH-Slu-Lm8-n1]